MCAPDPLDDASRRPIRQHGRSENKCYASDAWPEKLTTPHRGGASTPIAIFPDVSTAAESGCASFARPARRWDEFRRFRNAGRNQEPRDARPARRIVSLRTRRRVRWPFRSTRRRPFSSRMPITRRGCSRSRRSGRSTRGSRTRPRTHSRKRLAALEGGVGALAVASGQIGDGLCDLQHRAGRRQHRVIDRSLWRHLDAAVADAEAVRHRGALRRSGRSGELPPRHRSRRPGPISPRPCPTPSSTCSRSGRLPISAARSACR